MSSNPSRILRLPEVKSLSGLSRSTIYARAKIGHFPAPISLGDRAVGWLEIEVREWIAQRVAESRPHGTQPPPSSVTAASPEGQS